MQTQGCRTQVPAPCRPSVLQKARRDRCRRAASRRQKSRAMRLANFYACGQCACCILSVLMFTLTLLRPSRSLPQSFREEIARLDPMCRIVRARVDAAGFRLLGAEITCGCLLLDNGLFMSRIFMILSLRGERM